MAEDKGNLTEREKIEHEIKTLVDLLKRYREGDIAALRVYSYQEAVKKLMYLRVRQTQIKKKKK